MMPMTRPFESTPIVVAIPTLDEAKNIEKVIRKLAAEKSGLPNLSIVVTDGGSKDGTRAIVHHLMAEFKFLHLVDNEKKIQSAGINQVAALWADRADVLIRCDAHAIYPDGFIYKLMSTLKITGADSVVIPMDTIGVSIVQKAIAWTTETPIGSGGAAHRGGRKSGFVDHGHHAAFLMSSFIKARGYDESFSQNEDAEFDCRLTQSGGKIFLDSDIRIKYLPRSTFAKLWQQYFSYGFGRSRTVIRHPNSLRVRQLAVPVHILAVSVSLLLFAFYHSAFFLGWPAFYLLTLCLVSVRSMSKHKSLAGLLTGLAALVMHTSWGLGFLAGMAVNFRQFFSPVSPALVFTAS
jgi:succinoglycan biosynthesis protein ExoA